MPRLDIDARARAIAERGNALKASREAHGPRLSWRQLNGRTILANRRARAAAKAAKAARVSAALAKVAEADIERARLALQDRCAKASEAFAGDDSAGFGFTMREGRRASGGAPRR